MEVDTRGVASHGSAPERGENAIYKMAPIIAGIERLNLDLRAVPPLRKGTVVVSRVESKAPSVCSVPEACRIHLDRRMTTGETREQVVGEIEAIAEPHGGHVSVCMYDGESYKGLRMQREEYYPAWLTPEDAPIVRAALDAHKALFDGPGEVIVWDFSTNGVATSGVHGIPTIGFGPGDAAMAHVRDECVPVEHLVRAAAFYAALPSFFGRR
jgi:putative selenium metabolism hydrolase